jgi:transmembrane sensor
MDKRKRGFLNILQRYMDNASGKEEKQVMDTWYNSIDRENGPELDLHAKEALESRLWHKIQDKKEKGKDEPVIIKKGWWDNIFLKLASAASVLFVLGFLYYASDYRKSRNFPGGIFSAAELADLTETKNTTVSKKVVRLADGSQVTLEPGSSLFYPGAFGKENRSVYLSGDGFFDIAKNPEKPFLVYTEDIVTKVLGTSFTIHKNVESGNVEVAVMTGKVIVEKAMGSHADFEVNNSGVMLTPNKKVTFMHDTDKYVTSLVEKPVLLEESKEYQKPGSFNFEEAPLESVVAKLEKAYGVQIEIANESVANCPITADLPDESLFTKLEIINALLNTKSEVKGTTITLTGGECAPFKSANPNP